MTPCATLFLSRYEYELSGGPAIGFSDAHRLYAWLLTRLPEEEAEWLHESGDPSVSQHIRKEYGTGKTIWSVNILSQEANEVMSPALEAEMEIGLHPETLKATLVRQNGFQSQVDYIRHAREHAIDRVAEVSLLSPMAFHQAGHYVIYPQEQLLLRSLVKKWNAAFMEFPLEDEDAMTALENGILIRDYQLRTVRFALKGNKIPGCLGKLYLQSRLPEPLFEIWNLLLQYGTYCGAGIKTTLGMGAMGFSKLK